MSKSDAAVNEPAPTAGDGDREQQIRARAYEISQSENAGTAEENWRRAEQEMSPNA